MSKRTLVCGSRNWTDEAAIYRQLQGRARDVVIEGGAEGADTLARICAERLGLRVEEYLADWATHGRAAGPIRNQRMLDEAKPDLVMAFFMPGSRGTVDMVRRAIKSGIPVKLYGAVPVEFSALELAPDEAGDRSP